MEKDHLDPIAAHLIGSYLDTGAYSRQFKDDNHDVPPSNMARVHHHRSLMQARIIHDDAYDLSPSYVDFGRVEFVERQTEERILLRSATAVAIQKRWDDRGQGALFGVGSLLKPVDIRVLVYEFDAAGLTLSIAAGAKRAASTRVYVKGEPIFAGFWPYFDDGGSDDVPFDQGSRDPFGDVGTLEEDEEAGQ
ncbi:hypothetical protein D9V37_00640 [Nocardioides mangrovicus]|uniref:Uncharacterized protein n=1 Tax=Nocardioides mangrovicus TaxID=2478913 RepID=A0A3L8P6D3_9ACTN|nr:hypothetical protein [Nocardioides mangrovicus]RLV50532.1 hypothetical protein D9V37_00640 [Nocardioides mangrovicus]